MINFKTINESLLLHKERDPCLTLNASSFIGLKSIFETMGAVQAKLNEKPASIANVFVHEMSFFRHLEGAPRRSYYLEMILNRWEKALPVLMKIEGNLQEYKTFIQNERTFFYEQIELYRPSSIKQQDMKVFLRQEKVKYFQNVVLVINSLMDSDLNSEFKTCLFSRMQLILDYFSSLNKKLEGFVLKDGQEFIRERCSGFLCEKYNLLCKRVEKIWQSRQSQLLLPDDRLTLGKFFLEGQINDIVYQAIEEEVDVCLIRQIVECLNVFEKTFNYFYILMAKECYLKLNEREKAYFKDPFSPDGGSFRSIKHSFLSYITKGPLSNEVDFSLFCNPELKCFFFEITNEQRKVVGHLLGSIHILPEEAAKLPKHIQKAFQAADAFAVEVDVYKEREIESIESEIGFNKTYFASLGWNSIKLLDREYILAAKKMNKTVISLECKGKAKEVEICLEKVVNHKCNLVDWYPVFVRLGNLELLKNFYHENVIKYMSKEDVDLVVHSRDKVQASGIDVYLKQHPEKRLFTMVGVAHLPGVIDLLEKKGWHLEQV